MEDQWLLGKAISFIQSSLWHLFHVWIWFRITLEKHQRLIRNANKIFDVCYEVYHKKINLFCFVRYLFSRVIEYIVCDILCLCAFVGYWQNQGKKDQSTNEMRFVFIWLLFNYCCKQYDSIWYRDMNSSTKNIRCKNKQNNGLQFSKSVHLWYINHYMIQELLSCKKVTDNIWS